MRTTRSRPGRGRRPLTAVALTAGLLALSTVTLSAHDFWIVPTAFVFAADGALEVRGQTSTAFPTSLSAVAPNRVAEARLIGATGEERLGDLSVSGTSLRIRHRPTTPGQRVVAVGLATRTSRAASSGLKRYIALEGAPELAQRYERDGLLPTTDSITQKTTKFAKTIVEVGGGGPRAFGRIAGHPLELVPVTDPATLRAGDTLAVQLLFRGRPLAGAHLHAGAAAAEGDSAKRQDLSIVTGSDGVARLPVDRPGLWNVRTLHAAPAESAADTWDVLFATIVFHAAAR